MKKLVVSGIIALFMMSCSGEEPVMVTETKSLVPVDTDSVAKELDTVYEPYDMISVYDHNKVIKQVLSNGDWELNFSYNAAGELSGLTQINNIGQTVFDRIVTYDNMGRITGKNDTTYYIDQNRTATENVSYTYNDDNTVTVAIGNSIEGNELRTYYFDNSGKVVKITKDGYIQQEIEYAGNNISKIGNTNYFYDTSISVKGQYLNRYRNQFSSYKNFVLYNGYSVPNAIADNYVTKVDGEWASDDYDYTYEFDEDGYPVSQTVSNSQIQETIKITYK